MKINSAFAKGAFCPSCKKYVIGQENKPDPAWKCIYCPAKICSYCYDTHTAEVHPDVKKIFTRDDGEIFEGESFTIVNASRSTP